MLDLILVIIIHPFLRVYLLLSYIWDLHSRLHDFTIQTLNNISQSVLGSSLGYVSVVLFWISSLYFIGCYNSSYCFWLNDSLHFYPSSSFIYNILNQESFNLDFGGYNLGLYNASGVFQLWRFQGIISYLQLKCSCLVFVFISLLVLILFYFVTHIRVISYQLLNFRLYLFVLGGLSLAWSGHIVHISQAVCLLLESGVSSYVIFDPKVFLTKEYISLVDLSLRGGFYCQLAAHHLYVGLVFIISSVLPFYLKSILNITSSSDTHIKLNQVTKWHAMLAISLILTSGLSGLLAHNVISSYCYPYLSYDLSIILGIFVHHIIISCFTLIGGLAHLIIYIIRVSSISFVTLIRHRDIIIGHLIWVCIFLGVHSFGIYIHNDCLLALNRPQDTFGDYSISLKPYLCLFLLSLNLSDNLLILNSISCKVMKPYTSYGLIFSTSEFMVHHIHAFILHVLVLIWLKGLIYSRESKTIPDKCLLGFRV